uniref:BZIP domain-containing protein n=1 Tax=Caenorhabditis tropicalis TaxID=1561998 RepID=A0A1I7UW92_9PELO
MFSRVGRLTTFGAQAVSNCPLRRDNIYQQPLKITAPINDQLVNFAHNFSDSVRQRTTSFGNDPFLGVPMDDDEVIKELELLDLDSWHNKPRQPCPAPSDELELDQFWDGKNITLEAWRPTDTWQTGGMGHQQQSSQQQTVGHSSTTEMMHDFSNFGDNMGCSSPLYQVPSKSSDDQTASHEFQFGMPPSNDHQERKLSKFELDIETESKAVDWEAWNHYLESDDDVAFKRPEAFFRECKEEPMFVTSSNSMTTSTSSPDSGIGLFEPLPPPQQFHNNFSLSSSSSSANLFKLATPAASQIQTYQPMNTSRIQHDHDEDLFSSGPLLCIPKQEEIYDDYIQKDDSDEDYIPVSESRRTSSRLQRKSPSATSSFLRRRDSERSWTPASDDFYPFEEKQKYKKRGVVLKPSVDEETDRRRALNRIAAVRYREKKRAEKMGRKREFQDVVDRNRTLLQKERQLKRDIASMKKELRKMGAIIQ